MRGGLKICITSPMAPLKFALVRGHRSKLASPDLGRRSKFASLGSPRAPLKICITRPWTPLKICITSPGASFPRPSELNGRAVTRTVGGGGGGGRWTLERPVCRPDGTRPRIRADGYRRGGGCWNWANQTQKNVCIKEALYIKPQYNATTKIVHG